ncbi:hypothetical protein LUZ61_009312 [Rhynchospora tenuis]|uniref:NB-ARC domain-containing protein n=1 Tax=Rhynchospora tenuis TaxID=198213 RepID=A0AAD5ZX66_9POAL|nr:hypothetical protein LUZ61_009312 [Rhynchospora tenuis]
MRYFLILDNVHDGIEYNWSSLFSVLSYGAPGSFILVTTQSERVAKSIGNMFNIITLGVLEPDWFDILFKYYAFGGLFDFDPKSGRGSISRRNNIAIAELFNLDDATLSALELIATKIACKLHGLPLAGKVIGKILHTRLERVYWEEILRSDWWNEECALEGILPSLEIGFMDLDPDLKECFKFCSIFPKYYVFDRNTLVQMWMAHDFVKPNKEESFQLDIKEIRLEDVGKKRFDKLVDRSFFQATISEGKYVMHDLIRELAIAVSSKEFYYVKSINNHLPSSGRHVGIDRDILNVEGINQNNTTLRSVILFGNWINSTDESINNFFAKSTSLRLLDLSYIQFETNAPFDAICQLSHLRFVDLSFSRINFIPDKFCELCHLQVLNVRGCKFGKLPKDINKLINLRHFYASVETTSLISGIGKLTNLQELEEFRVEKRKGYEISELRDMNEISGHLLLSDLQNISSKDEAATSQLTEKKYLKSLELRFKDHSGVPLEVLEALKPSPSVEEVTIYSRRGEYLPCWISQKENSNLKRVEIRSFWLSTLPAFGELPYLEVLSFHELLDLEKVGDEFYGYSSVVFPSLKELTFSVMPRWTVWSDSPVGKMSFPHLVKIHLKNCERLREMPTNSFPSSMLELKLDFCQNINNISTVLQGMRCLTHLSISKCRNDRIFDYCTELNMLEFLHLSEIKRLCFVRGLKSLINLRKLEIVGFDEILQSFEVQQENEGPSQQNRFLTSLHLDHSNSSTQRLPVAGRFKYLRFLLIRNSPVTEYTEGEENWFNQLTSLETLEFSNCRHLTRLPSTLPLLTKLKKLSIEVCPMISSLPEFSLPPYLTELYITGCSHELKERCLPHQGDDWWKISHIPNIQIDRENSSYIL